MLCSPNYCRCHVEITKKITPKKVNYNQLLPTTLCVVVGQNRVVVGVGVVVVVISASSPSLSLTNKTKESNYNHHRNYSQQHLISSWAM